MGLPASQLGDVGLPAGQLGGPTRECATPSIGRASINHDFRANLGQEVRSHGKFGGGTANIWNFLAFSSFFLSFFLLFSSFFLLFLSSFFPYGPEKQPESMRILPI